MLIAQQKSRLHMIGHCNRLCHVITCNTCETWGLIYSHTMRTVPAHARRQASHSYVYMALQKLLMDMLFMPAEQCLSKLTTSHFSTLNRRIANQNMLKRILIAMHNGNKANCNENFRICLEERMAPLYKR